MDNRVEWALGTAVGLAVGLLTPEAYRRYVSIALAIVLFFAFYVHTAQALRWRSSALRYSLRATCLTALLGIPSYFWFPTAVPNMAPVLVAVVVTFALLWILRTPEEEVALSPADFYRGWWKSTDRRSYMERHEGRLYRAVGIVQSSYPNKRAKKVEGWIQTDSKFVEKISEDSSYNAPLPIHFTSAGRKAKAGYGLERGDRITVLGRIKSVEEISIRLEDVIFLLDAQTRT